MIPLLDPLMGAAFCTLKGDDASHVLDQCVPISKTVGGHEVRGFRIKTACGENEDVYAGAFYPPYGKRPDDICPECEVRRCSV